MLGAAVTGDAFAGKDLHIDHGALRALVHAQGRVFHVTGFFTEDGAQKLFFRRQRGLTFGRHFADQRIARLDFGTDINNAGLVQTVELLLAQVGDVARDFFRAQLGVAGHHHQLFDVDRGVAVFSDHALADQNRVFEVVTIPGHERHQHVLTQCEFTQVGGRAVGDHIAFGQLVAFFDDGTLVDVGVLVGTLVLDQVVNVHTDFTRLRFRVVHADHHAGGIHIVDHATTVSGYHGTRVHSSNTLDTGSNKRLLRTQHGHGLTLHVRAHQSAVGIVVLQERNQGRCHRDDLRRRHVHVLHALGAAQNRLAFFAG